jgi:predicted nucleotidyltransferase
MHVPDPIKIQPKNGTHGSPNHLLSLHKHAIIILPFVEILKTHRGKGAAMNRTQGNQAVHLSEEFVADLVQELDNEDIIGITLGGSYARGEATQYSDLDFACFWRAGLRPPPKRFMYRRGKLISVKMTTVDEIRGMLSRPESALLFASGKHRLLLDKDGSVARLLEEIANFRWETLQPVANWSTNIWMMLKAEEENIKPIRARGIAALYLYRETLALVKPAMQDEQLAVAEQALQIVKEAVEQLPFTVEEYQWLKSWA